MIKRVISIISFLYGCSMLSLAQENIGAEKPMIQSPVVHADNTVTMAFIPYRVLALVVLMASLSKLMPPF